MRLNIPFAIIPIVYVMEISLNKIFPKLLIPAKLRIFLVGFTEIENISRGQILEVYMTNNVEGKLLHFSWN